MEEDRRVRACFHALILLNDLVGHGVVRDQAAGPVVLAHLVDAVHFFQAEERIQAQIGVSRIPAPVFGPEAVHRRRLVALCLEVVGQSEHRFGYMLLVGLAAVGQERDGVTRQRLKLHIAGTAAKAGAVGPAIGAGLLQPVEVGGNVCVKLIAVLLQLRDIPIGLVHHIDDGRLLHDFICRGVCPVGLRVERAGGVLFPRLHVIQDLVDRLFRIFLGFINFQIGQVGQKAGDDAIVAVIAVLHPGVRQDAKALRHGGLQKDAEHQRAAGCRAGGKACHPLRPAQLCPLPVEEERAHRQHQHHHDGNGHAGLDMDAGRRGHTRRLRDLHQVPRQERLTPQLEGVKIDRRGHAAQNGCDQCGQRRKPGQPVHGQPDQEQQRPGQGVGFPVGPDVLCKGIRVQRAACDPLRQHQHHQRCQRREHEPRRMEQQRRMHIV